MNSSRLWIWWLTADVVTHSSSEAARRLPSLAVASKARIAAKGGSCRDMSDPSIALNLRHPLLNSYQLLPVSNKA
jgi:hypothetical protein